MSRENRSECYRKGICAVVRNQKAVQFIVLRDHTGLIQIVVERSEANSAVNELISTLDRESAIQVTGLVVSNPNVKLGQMEVQLETLHVVSRCRMLPCQSIFPARQKAM